MSPFSHCDLPRTVAPYVSLLHSALGPSSCYDHSYFTDWPSTSIVVHVTSSIETTQATKPPMPSSLHSTIITAASSSAVATTLSMSSAQQLTTALSGGKPTTSATSSAEGSSDDKSIGPSSQSVLNNSPTTISQQFIVSPSNHIAGDGTTGKGAATFPLESSIITEVKSSRIETTETYTALISGTYATMTTISTSMITTVETSVIQSPNGKATGISSSPSKMHAILGGALTTGILLLLLFGLVFYRCWLRRRRGQRLEDDCKDWLRQPPFAPTFALSNGKPLSNTAIFATLRDFSTPQSKSRPSDGHGRDGVRQGLIRSSSPLLVTSPFTASADASAVPAADSDPFADPVLVVHGKRPMSKSSMDFDYTHASLLNSLENVALSFQWKGTEPTGAGNQTTMLSSDSESDSNGEVEAVYAI